jgi:hypothetical protein
MLSPSILDKPVWHPFQQARSARSGLRGGIAQQINEDIPHAVCIGSSPFVDCGTEAAEPHIRLPQ